MEALFKGEPRMARVTKPYSERDLLSALMSVGILIAKQKS